jgi:hypothetical protein
VHTLESCRNGCDGEGKQVSNKVLLAAPDYEYELMRADLTYIDLPHHLSLHEPTQKIEFVYFPNRGMVSQVVVTKDGRTVEVGVEGNEGYAGAGLAAGLSRSSVREIIQIAGDFFRMMGNALERILRSAPHIRGFKACKSHRPRRTMDSTTYSSLSRAGC